MTMVLRTAAIFMLFSLAAGCEEKKPNLAPVASALASVQAPTGPSVRRFAITGESNSSIDMEAPKQTLRGTTTGGTGHLDIDFAKLASSRGEVKLDLSTLTMKSFTDASRNAAQTTHARTWLEVADGQDGKLEDKVKEANRYAVYAIRSIENLSAPDLAKIAPTRDGADEIRTLSMMTKGELLVHGHKVERDADVEVSFRYEPGAAADAPHALQVKTKKPFKVVLAEHDVKPRDGFGKIAKDSFHLLGTKVADIADLTLDLRAKRQP
jgi:hypothetical protein